MKSSENPQDADTLRTQLRDVVTAVLAMDADALKVMRNNIEINQVDALSDISRKGEWHRWNMCSDLIKDIQSIKLTMKIFAMSFADYDLLALLDAVAGESEAAE